MSIERKPEGTVRYLCLCYGEAREDGHGVAGEGRQPECDDDLRASGYLVAAEVLAPAVAAASVRVHAGRVSVAGCPAAPALEPLSAFVLIDARDLNEAIRVAATLPAARTGRVEIHPIRTFADPPPFPTPP